MMKYSHKELPETFSGKFEDIRAKIFRTAKNLPAPTPVRTKRHTAGVSPFLVVWWKSVDIVYPGKSCYQSKRFFCTS